MNKKGLSRPGAMLMAAAVVLLTLAAIGPIVMAASTPSHEWSMILTGPSALATSAAGLFSLLLYAVGYLKYCSSKGYSTWLALWLLLGNLPGFVVLLLLPDLHEIKGGVSNSNKAMGNEVVTSK